MKYSFMLLLVAVAFGACNSFENNKFNAPLRSVTSEVIVFPDSILIGRTHLFCVADSFILLYDKYDNKNFTIVNLRNNSVARICPLGQGPGELISPSPYVSALKKEGKTYLYFYDMALYKMFQFDADMVFIKNNIAGEELISIESGHFDQNGITLCPFLLDSEYDWLALGFYTDGFLAFFNDGKKMKSFGISTIKDATLPLFQKIQCDANIIRLSPNKKILVRSSQVSGLIEAYFVEKDTLINMFSKHYFDVEYQKQGDVLAMSSLSRYGYIDVCASDSLIFGLYSGKYVMESNSFQSRFVHIYDLNGKLLEILELPEPVCAIDRDISGKAIYAITSEGDKKVIKISI